MELSLVSYVKPGLGQGNRTISRVNSNEDILISVVRPLEELPDIRGN